LGDTALRWRENYTNTVVIFFLSAALFYLWQFRTPFLPENDGYYHIKFADLMRTQGFIRDFPWAEWSLWFKNFSDKEFLFHVYLIPFTAIFDNLHTAAKVATVLLASVAVTSFYVILLLNKVRWAALWWFLLMSSGGYFLYRANVPRPQVLSIALCLWSIHFILNNKRIALAVLCFLYTSAYTGYILPFIFSCTVSGYLLFFEKEFEWKTPLTVLAATAAGMVFHPYFPDNITMFWVQNFYVLWMGTNGSVDLKMGGEFRPMDTKKMLEVITSVLIPFFLAFLVSLKGSIKADKKTRALFMVALSLIVLTMTSKRFAEYSVPVTLWFCAAFFNPFFSQYDLKALWRKRAARTALIVFGACLVLGLLFVRSYRDVARQYSAEESGFKAPALYVKEHAPKGSLIYTCDWDDTPEIFFYNSDNNYPVFLDPNFMYVWNPDFWQKWFRVSNGMEGDRTYHFFKNVFNVEWGICTSNFSKLRRIIEGDKRMEIILRTPHSYLFRVR
jgi:hypothetical protein